MGAQQVVVATWNIQDFRKQNPVEEGDWRLFVLESVMVA